MANNLQQNLENYHYFTQLGGRVVTVIDSELQGASLNERTEILSDSGSTSRSWYVISPNQEILGGSSSIKYIERLINSWCKLHQVNQK